MRTEVARTDGEPVRCRLLASRDELDAAGRVIAAVWGEQATALVSPELLRAYTHFGNPVLGAYEGESLSGVSIAFLAPRGEIHLHSHATGVLPSRQHAGVGFALKRAQREWCLANGIAVVTWTFDPMLSRNAYFNLRKLGATAVEFLRDFYGDMADELNRGERSDRLQVRWSTKAARVDRALEGQPIPIADGDVDHWIGIPHDYVELRQRDPSAAQRARDDTADRLERAFAAGLVVADFDPARGYALVPRSSPPV
jgi:predicted GNAT superfamily acetyltransferase